MHIRFLVFTALLAMAGCAAHEKAGDRAAAVGDWKKAVSAYRQALSREPDSPTLREKFAQARVQAGSLALLKANNCASQKDWGCALKEADYALVLDEANAEARRLRIEAARAQAEALINEARGALERGDPVRGLSSVRAAEEVCREPDVRETAGRLRADLLVAVDREIARLRGEEAFEEAVAMLERVVREDASKAPLLAMVRAEFDTLRAARAEALAVEGDAALTAREWARAVERYRAAESIRPGGRSLTLARYAGAMDEGERAIAARRFDVATAAYRAALSTGRDSDGLAASQLGRTEVRPYAIRLRALLVKPVRPDGQPWVGPPNPLLGKIVKAVAGGAMPGVGAAVAGAAVDIFTSVPPENRPTLVVDASMPDEQRLRTAEVQGIYVTFDAKVIVGANHFDERRVTFNVRHTSRGREDDVGVVDVSLGELVAAGSRSLADQSILSLQLIAEPEERLSDGMFVGMHPLNEDNRAADFSMPSPGKQGFQLINVRARGVIGDYENEMGMDGPPDLYVTVQQAERLVYRSPVVQDKHDAAWEPRRVWLWVSPGEQLYVRVWDKDAIEDDHVLVGWIDPRLPRSVVRTERGSFVELTFSPRTAPLMQAALRR